MSDQTKYPSQLAERFQIRMPEGLRDRLREAAEANKRSMNAEIVARLESSFVRDEAQAGSAVPLDSMRAWMETILDLASIGRLQNMANADDVTSEKYVEVMEKIRKRSQDYGLLIPEVVFKDVPYDSKQRGDDDEEGSN